MVTLNLSTLIKKKLSWVERGFFYITNLVIQTATWATFNRESDGEESYNQNQNNFNDPCGEIVFILIRPLYPTYLLQKPWPTLCSI